MKCYNKILITLSFLTYSIVPTSLQAGIFELSFRDISTGNELARCEAKMAEISSNFAKLSGAAVLGVGCDHYDIFDSYNGHLSYSAQTEVAVWSNSPLTISRRFEFFYSREECEAGLIQELNLMKSLTGLTSFASFCAESSIVGPHTYRTEIRAIGTSTVVRAEEYADLMHRPNNLKRITDELTKLAIKRGLYVAQCNLLHEVGNSILFVGVYDDLKDEHINELAGEELLSFTSEGACEFARNTLNTSWSHKLLPAVFSCGVLSNNRSSLTAIWWGGYYASGELRTNLLPNAYKDAVTCESEAKKIVATLAGQGQKVIGTLCGYSGIDLKNVRLEIYTP